MSTGKKFYVSDTDGLINHYILIVSRKIAILFESQAYNILPKETSGFSWHDCW